MTEIILHAGFHKTGSSSIQQSLAALPMDDVAYLDWGHVNHSMPFLAGFTNGEMAEMTGPVPASPASRAARLRLEAALLEADKPRLILSAEAFSVAGYKPGLVALRDVLLAHATRITVIAYVRPLAALIPSDFQQCARAGLNIPLGRSPDYLQRMAMLDDVFGAQNVHFHVFSPQTLLHGDVVRDFGMRIGVDIPKAAVKRVNESVSLECVAAARCAALFGEVGVRPPVDLALNYFATNQLQKLGNSRFRIASDTLMDLVAPHAAELERVQQRIGGLFPPFTAQVDGIRSDEDLFAVASGVEGALKDMVGGLGRTQAGRKAAGTGIDRAGAEPRAEILVAFLVDTIKRVRLAEAGQAQAA